MLTNSGRYTWDVAAELELGPEKMATLVEKAPSLSWDQRYKYAVDFVKSTAPSKDLPWMNDRKCPFTGDGSHPMTPVEMLDYRHNPYNGTNPKAIGCAAPLVSQAFYNLVDKILIEGGWGYGSAKNNIDERHDPCDEAAKQKHIRDKFDPNEYYEDVKKWHKEIEKPLQEEL